jgi:TatA/E family protein of Tat protein translocase
VLLANITGDWYWIVLAIVILFGGSQLPKLARNAGDAMREFRKAHSEASQGDSGFHQGAYQQPPAIAAPPAQPAAVPATSAPAQQAEERVTLSRAELDALLADREARARASQPGASAQQQ